MIKLKTILETFKHQGFPSTWSKMIMLVISNTDATFEDKIKRDLFLKTFKKMLEKKTSTMDYDFSTIKPTEKIDNLKFYPATNKIIGIFPAYMFKGSKINFQNFIYYHELVRLFPNLEMKEKQKT